VDRCAVRANTLRGVLDTNTQITGVHDGILVEGQADAAASRDHDVRLNYVDRVTSAEVAGPGLAGITLVNVRDTAVADNAVVNRRVGIAVVDTDRVRVESNRLREVGVGVMASGSAGLRVSGNVLSRVEDGPSGIFANALTGAEIEGNDIDRFRGAIAITNGSDNRVAGNRLRRGLIGILAGPEPGVLVSGNQVEQMQAAGIAVVGGEDATLSHNHVAGCGWDVSPAGLGIGAGIAVLSVEGSVTVESCEVVDTGRPPAGQGVHPAVGIGVVLGDEQMIRNNRVTGPVAGIDQTIGYPALGVLFSQGRADVTDNVLSGAGAASVAAVRAFSRRSEIIFTGNRCRDLTDRTRPSKATVLLSAGRLGLASNQVAAENALWPSIDLGATPIISAVGNVTRGVWINMPGVTANVRPFPVVNFNCINV
jgi:nitrous oxidase accessory protein NosD